MIQHARRAAAILILVSLASTSSAGQLRIAAVAEPRISSTDRTTPRDLIRASHGATHKQDEGNQTGEGLAVPESDRLRIKIRMMAALFNDGSISSLGFEQQGRLGYAIIELAGKATDRLSYFVEINPVNETRPLPSCGEEFFFYPNDPRNFQAGP
ncbi:MAG: hypothetical protein HYZ58_00100, partial [Acidobacteria bacterium]|nr:hypothetical protein [Acidobacteriota bacterium]